MRWIPRRRARPAPTEPRAQNLARRLRRLRADLAETARQEFLPGKQLRIRAGRLAYLDLLIEACALVGVPHELLALRGFDQQLEVLRVEAALSRSGVPCGPLPGV